MNWWKALKQVNAEGRTENEEKTTADEEKVLFCRKLNCKLQKVIVLTPWSSVLDKLPVAQLLKNFRIFYGTQFFVTMFTRACPWSLP
jgi:hypothetical protein